MASSYQQHLTPRAEFSIFDENSAESNEDNLIMVEDLEVSAESAQVLNHTYRNMLLDLREQLNTLRYANSNRQSELKREIEILTEQEANKKSEKHRRKRFSLSFFGMPYFKDLALPYFNVAPPNADTNQILSITKGLGLYNVSMIHFNKPRECTKSNSLLILFATSKLMLIFLYSSVKKTDVNKIKAGMKPAAETFESQRLVTERGALEQSLTDEMSDGERKIVQRKIEELNRKLLHVRFEIPRL